MDNVLRKWRLATIFSIDILMVILAWFTTFALRQSGADIFSAQILFFLPFVLMIYASSFYFCGLYRGIWRFASIPDLVRILKAVFIGMVALGSLSYFYEASILAERQQPIIFGAFLLLFLAGPRILYRWMKDHRAILANGKRVLIVGAGSAGEGIVRDLMRLPLYGYQPIAFVDDNVAKLGQDIHGVRVRGTCKDIPFLVEQLQIELILIATVSASSANMRLIVNYCEQAKVPFRTLPGIQELAEGRVSINALREVSLDDLLGREQVNLAWDKIYSSVTNKTVVITGGGGSIGSELSMQVAALMPKQLVIIDSCEFNLYSIQLKLKKKFPSLMLFSYLCSVTDKKGIQDIFSKYAPDLVFHTAAYKHVPLLESQIRIAIFNNIVGTRVVSEAAVQHNVAAFVLISTDKAVNPSNVMGATKRASEIFCQNLNFTGSTRFITVRFGNVLDSAGSVVPLFRKQLAEGGPLTVTHPEMTRFFMTIPEASQLILQAASMGDGGEIFVLDMGEPIKIRYLAEQLIKLSGKVLGKDVDIEYTGLRPGEKLYEELFYSSEQLTLTTHPKIRKAKAQRVAWQILLELFTKIEDACYLQDEKKLLYYLHQLVPEYKIDEALINAVENDAAYLQLIHSQ